jgi:SanA protein
MNKKKFKIILKWGMFVSVIGIVLMWFTNFCIYKQTNNLVYKQCKHIPTNKVGLLLGTSKYLRNGSPNLYFVYRIQAAEQLFKAGKISYIVISGDNGRKNYNEPQAMKEELVKRGIPPEKIYLDYAGFRTFDSVYRLKYIFGQDSFTVISQEFHNRRAIYIAQCLHLKAIGYNAKDVDAYNGFKTKVREIFARTKVFMDMLSHQQPRFLGEKIVIE